MALVQQLKRSSSMDHKKTETIQTVSSRTHKRLRLTVKSQNATSATTLTAQTQLLDKCTNSNEALQILIQISDILQFNDGDILNSIKKLIERYRIESESAVRVKILALFAELSHLEQQQRQLQQQIQQQILQKHQQQQQQQQTPTTLATPQSQQPVDGTILVDDIINLLQTEKSAKVISQGLHSLYKIGEHQQFLLSTITKIVNFSKSQLMSMSHNVQRHALLLLGTFSQINCDEIQETLDLISHYADSQDARVRAQALCSILILGRRGVNLTTKLYPRALNALKDDYECVRKEALQLVYELSIKHPDHMIDVANSDSQLRLIDAAFGSVCSAICDLSMHVRTQAAELLGGMTSVSNEFLHQTLDKKLMSDLRRKRSLHENYSVLFQSGEWSTGKRWADDKPKENIDIDTVSLMASGACGALVHGLEDEFLEVRTAAVDSMCRLALKNPPFAVISLDFLVDMFNDEIENVRLRAIYSLTSISKHIVLREDQLETMLGSLEDYSVEVREGLHIMLGACKVSTQTCLLMVVHKVLDVLSKYPQDKLSAFGCLQRVGQKHPELCMSLVSQLLQDHPFFDTAERDVEDPSYVCILIMLFNAAQLMPPLLSLLPETTVKHFAYLRDTMPNFVPYLPIGGIPKQLTLTDTITGSRQFLETLLHNVEAAYAAPRARQALLNAAQANLDRLAAIDPELSGTANYTATFLGAQLIIEQLQSCLTAANSRTPSKECLNQLLKKCLKLQNLFSGLTLIDLLMVKQISLRASALHLVLIVKDRSQSALGPCQLLLHIVTDTSNFLQENADMQPDSFTTSILGQIANITDPKPGRIFREILPIVQTALPIFTPQINVNIKICTAKILEPPTDLSSTDSVVKVTAGLIAALPLVAEINNLQQNQRQDLRLRIKYPDQNVHLVVPRLRDLKRIMTESGAEENNWRLRTIVLLSHGVWTEASQVEISICLSVRPGHELELCKPIKVFLAPKPVKRGI